MQLPTAPGAWREHGWHRAGHCTPPGGFELGHGVSHGSGSHGAAVLSLQVRA